jgi:hypothetical protein
VATRDYRPGTEGRGSGDGSGAPAPSHFLMGRGSLSPPSSPPHTLFVFFETGTCYVA